MNSRAFRKFKTEMGQANHFLITIMVGLDAVEDGAKKRESFKTTWNPENRTNSVVRSKKYAIKSALAWTVDNLDMYLRLTIFIRSVACVKKYWDTAMWAPICVMVISAEIQF